jgi:AcrR family transcriptional regulator
VGRKLGLSVADVVAAAMEIADAEGLDAVSLASVAERLGVRSPSLYTHVDGLPGLRRRLALDASQRMAVEFQAAAADRAGAEALRELAYAYRRFARLHPGLYQAAQRAVRPGEDDELYDALAAAVAPVFRVLSGMGIGDDDRVHLARAFRSALHGFVVLEQGGGFGMPESVDESFQRLVNLLVTAVRAASADAMFRTRLERRGGAR